MTEHELELEAAEASETLRYRHVIETIASKPWAIKASTLAVIVDLLQYRAAGHRLTAEEIQERIEAGQTRAAARGSTVPTRGALAVLPLYGVIAPKAAAFKSVSSPNGTGVDEFTRAFRQALDDPDVGQILIDIDSPGGQVGMVPELASEIRAARGRKPITAIANTLAASAAYWIGSQADELVVTPSGEVGSIGVYAAHQDLSGALEQEGVKITLISAGRFKVEGNPFEPLTDEARAAIQADVEEFYSMFLDGVAAGRGATVDDVRSGYGQGRTATARAALAAGMVDRIETFDQTVRRLLEQPPAPARRGRAAQTIEVQIGADRSQLEASLQDAHGVAWARYANAVPSHSTTVIDVPWDGPAEVAKLNSPVTKARGFGMFAWYDQNGNDPDGDGYPDAKDDWKFPHHRVVDGEPHEAVVSGCRNGLARLPNADIPEPDKAGVRAHLQRHIDDFNRNKANAAATAVTAAAEPEGAQPSPLVVTDADLAKPWVRQAAREAFNRA